MNKRERKTKPELWKMVEKLEKERLLLERYLMERGLLEEAEQYVENALWDEEDLPFD